VIETLPNTPLASPIDTYSPISLTMTTPAGARELKFAFDLQSPAQAEMHRVLSSGSFFEAETSMLLLTILRAGDRFADVGGHIGYFSVLASKVVGAAGEVVAFEPAASNHARLLAHLTMNGCDNVLPLQLAVGPRDAAVSLHLNSDNDGGHALWDVRTHPMNTRSRAHPAQQAVWMTRLDRVLGSRPVRAMKLDIEGSELGALQGAEPLLRGPSGIPFIIAEINHSALQWMGTSDGALRQYMDGLGYDAWAMQLADPQLVKLEPGVTVSEQFVFNVLFWKRGVPLP
jgi:FkbM family methyltransferase